MKAKQMMRCMLIFSLIIASHSNVAPQFSLDSINFENCISPALATPNVVDSWYDNIGASVSATIKAYLLNMWINSRKWIG